MREGRTLLCDAPALVGVEIFIAARLNHGGIAPGAGEGDLHRLVEELEALDIGDGGHGRLGGVKDDKGLALGLEVRLGHDVNHVAIFREDGVQGLLERFGLDALLEIADVNPATGRLVWPTSCARGCLVCVGVQ
jgi:hypothetical protein